MRRFNEATVLNTIREHGPISRIELARRIGLTESTITSIVRQLLSDELVCQDRMGRSTGGRPPQFLRLNESWGVIVGIAIGVSTTIVALSDYSGKLISRMECPTHRDPRYLAQSLADRVLHLVQQRDDIRQKLQGIGVAMPGLCNPSSGQVVYSANLGWEKVEFGSLLGEALKGRLDSPLFFEGEVRATALAEIWFGHWYQSVHGNVVTVWVGDGMGAGIIIGSQLYSGSTFGAGEVGHVSLSPEGPECLCGNRGCWEVYCSDDSTVKRYLGSVQDELQPGSAPPCNITIKEVIDLAAGGDVKAQSALRETGRYLGKGMSILINSLNPDDIIVHGRITRAWPFVYPEMIKEVQSYSLRTNREGLGILPSSLPEDPRVLGAVAIVFSHRFPFPKVGG